VAALAPAALILAEQLAAREGWAIAGILKRQPVTEHIPVLAYSLDESQNQGELLELNYLHKPLQAEQLASELAQILAPSDKPQAVLVVDDDPGILDMHSRLIEQTGRRVLTARNGREALAALEHTRPDLILLDLMMPEMDGYETCQELKRFPELKDTIIVFFTARSEDFTQILGLDAGADDYLVKPFDLDELSARIRALLRRQAGRASPLIEHGALSLNPATHEVFQDGAPVNLSGREFALLNALLEHPGVPLSRAQLEERIYGWDEEVESNTVEVYIHSLRRKLGAEWIRNVRGVGYRVPERP